MDWLIANHASIHCKEGSVNFRDKFGNVVLIQEKNGKPKACFTKASNQLRGSQKGLQIYVVKLNKVDNPKSGNDLEWLSEFRDIFPKELTKLSPLREVDPRE